MISGNAFAGLRLITITATLNVVQGNYVGTDASGTAALGNGANGIVILLGASRNQIGGTAPGAGNVASGNGGSGIACSGGSGLVCSNNTIQGNFCGTNASGTAAIPNVTSGIRLSFGAFDNLVGGTSPVPAISPLVIWAMGSSSTIIRKWKVVHPWVWRAIPCREILSVRMLVERSLLAISFQD